MLLLFVQKLAKFPGEGEHSTLVVFRAPNVQDNLTGLKVHLAPLEASDFPAPPPGDVCVTLPPKTSPGEMLGLSI